METNKFKLFIGQMLVGYAIGWSAPITSKLEGIHPPSHLPFIMTHMDAVWITSILFIGNLIGLYITWVLYSRKGSKITLLLASAFCNLSFLMIAQARDVAMFYIGRIFMGMGTGIINVVNLISIGEISSTSTRNILLTRSAIFSSIGTLLTFSIGPCVSYVKSLYLGFVLSMTYSAVVFFERGTAVFLTNSDEENEAKKRLTLLNNEEEEFENNYVHKNGEKWSELKFRGNSRLHVVVILSTLQQFIGATPILMFATDVLESALSMYVPNLATISMGIVQLSASFCASYALKKVRRRCLLLFSSGFCSLTMLSLAMYYLIMFYDKESIEIFGWLPMVALLIFLFSYSLGFGVVPDILISEMFPAQIKRSTFIIKTSISWTLSFITTFTLGYFLYNNVQMFICLSIFALFSALAFKYSFSFVPETKGLNLAEMENMFDDNKDLRVNLGELINGYGVAWVSPVSPKLDGDQSPLPYKVAETDKAWIASSTYIGCVGAYIGGYLSNRIGRSRSLLIGGILNLIAYIPLTAARSLVVICVGRAFLGMGMSFLSVVGLIYIAEITSPNIRGILMTGMGVFHASGCLLAYCVGPFVSYAGVSYVAIVLNVIYIGSCCFLPETPMYYVLKDDEKSASAALQYLGRNEDKDTELKIMMIKAQERKKNKHTLRELVSVKCNRKSLFVTICLSFFQQSSGVVTLIFYANTIFQYTGSSINPDLQTIIVGVIFVVGAIGAPMFIEKFGRRILLMVSTAGCCISMALLGVYFFYDLNDVLFAQHLGWIPLTLFITAQLTYSMGLSIIPNTLSGELFTAKVRGVGPSISLCSGWVSGFLTTTIFGYVVAAVGIHATFWMFAVSNALALLFVLLFVPETKGKSLTEIEDMMEK